MLQRTQSAIKSVLTCRAHVRRNLRSFETSLEQTRASGQAVAMPAPTSKVQDPTCNGPPLVANVGFAGHRRLTAAKACRTSLDQVLRALDEAMSALAIAPVAKGRHETVGEAYGGSLSWRLISGDAPGADRIMIERWRAANLGSIHVVYPFSDEGRPVTDDPQEAGADDHTSDPKSFDAYTVLDCVSLNLRGSAGHSEQAHWILRRCNLLVVIWNGRTPKGPGGTGDTVRQALARGIPVIWLNAKDGKILLIDSQTWPRHVKTDEALSSIEQYCETVEPKKLNILLMRLFAPPSKRSQGTDASGVDPETEARRDYAEHDPLKRSALDRWLDRSAWSAFARFKRAAGAVDGWPNVKAVDPLVQAPDLSEAGQGMLVLTAAFEEADARADLLGAIHRSQQLLMSAIAVAAVLFGSLPALAEPVHEWEVHVMFAAGELLLAVVSTVLSINASRARRHQRWSDARRLAERLRAARSAWPLNIDVADEQQDASTTWTEWRARAVLNAAGLPEGLFDRTAFLARARWAAAELIDGQLNYHAKEHHASERIERFLEWVKTGSVVLLVGALSSFLVVSGWASLHHMQVSHRLLGLIAVISATSPAVAAAALALESTNGFSELALRSGRLRERFEVLGLELEGLGLSGQHPHYIVEVLRSAARLIMEDADAWRENAVRRRLAGG